MDTLIQNASLLHGHLGPYLVLGLKAGLAAVETLGRDPFTMKAVVLTGGSPPSSCFIDGVQVATGCTLGKGNIDTRIGEGVSALFMKGESMFEVKVRRTVLNEICEKLSNGMEDELALEIAERRYGELFETRCDRPLSKS